MWTLAWRNLWRHRARTLIVGSAIALSYALFLILIGIEDHSGEEMSAKAEDFVGGALRVEGGEFTAMRTLDHLVPDGVALAERIAALPQVRNVRVEVELQGLLSSPRNNTGADLRGIDPDNWPTALEDLGLAVAEGRFLHPDDATGIALTRTVARELSVALGDRVVLTLSDPDGEVTRALFLVATILDVEPGGFDRIAFTHLQAAQRAANLGDAVTGIGVQLADSRQRFRLQPDLQAQVDQWRPDQNLAVLTWDEVLPELVAMIEVDRANTLVFLGLIFLVVVFAIANTMLMSVLERIREFGLLGALGLGPGHLIRLVFIEGALLTLAAMAVGLAIALAGHTAIATWGIPLGEGGLEYETAGISMVDFSLYSTLIPLHWIRTSVLIFVLSMLASIYPALRAMRLEPTEAMRTWK
ncbi:MAG: ABC transporter permease [Deltaproteobacteria bacterium]|nr:MAG: ABC transporter permease [Deltaproteobacteria bacterium]